MNKKLKTSEICCLYYFLIRAGFLGIASSNILHLSKQDGWISILLGILLGLLPLHIFLSLQKRYPNDSIFDLNKRILGQKFGKIINGILVIGVLFSTTVIFYNLINFIGSQYLNQTPTLAIAIMFFIAIIYILSKNIIVIARTHFVLLYFGIILLFLAIVGLINEVELSNLSPILEYGFSPVLKGSLSFVSFNVLPLFMLTAIPRNYVDHNQHLNRNIMITYFLGSLSLLFTFFFIMTIFGPHLSILYQYPEFHLLKLISLVGFISHMEGIIALHWLFDLFAFIVIGIYFVMQYLKDDWSISNKAYNPIMIILSILIIFATEHIFKNNTIANTILLHFSPGFLIFFFFIIPCFIFLFSFKKKLTKK